MTAIDAVDEAGDGAGRSPPTGRGGGASMLRSVGDRQHADVLAVALAEHRAEVADAVGEAERDRARCPTRTRR